MKKILVTGGRDYKDWGELSWALDSVFPIEEEIHIIEGGAIGADFLAQVWCEYEGVPYSTFEADWKKYGKAAGPIRNQKILDENPDIDVVIAFKGDKGTKDMVDRAIKKGIEVIRPYVNEYGFRSFHKL